MPSAATLAVIPEAGVPLAYVDSDAGLGVIRVTRKGPVEIYRDSKFHARRGAWVDATTFVALGAVDPDATELRWIVGGKLDPARTQVIRGAEWKGARGAIQADPASAEIMVGADGAVWLQGCTDPSDEYHGSECHKPVWLPAVAPRALTRTKPKKLRDPNHPPLPARAAPAGYTAKVTAAKFPHGYLTGKKMRGIECSGAAGAATWRELRDDRSGEMLAPTKLQWVSATPPVFAVTGVVFDPGSGVSPATWLFRACEPTHLNLHWLDDHIWARPTSETQWTVHVDDQPVAVIAVPELATVYTVPPTTR